MLNIISEVLKKLFFQGEELADIHGDTLKTHHTVVSPKLHRYTS